MHKTMDAKCKNTSNKIDAPKFREVAVIFLPEIYPFLHSPLLLYLIVAVEEWLRKGSTNVIDD